MNLFFGLLYFCRLLSAQTESYPHNATTCEHCHALPSKFGSSPLTVERVGHLDSGHFVPGAEGGVIHRFGASLISDHQPSQITGERVTISLMGDGFIEAIDLHDIEHNSQRQRQAKLGIAGQVVEAPVLESSSFQPVMQAGRFGWKNQHSSLISACADSLRTEIGMRNRFYPDEYETHKSSDGPTPLDVVDSKTGKTHVEDLLGELRHIPPPGRDPKLVANRSTQLGERVFARIGCSMCHVATYKTLPPGTLINGGTYVVPDFLGNTVIHPYSDFLLHDIGTGDRIPQAAKPEYLDDSTANKFRTAPLWGLRSRAWLMHDGGSSTTDEAIGRHKGEASIVRQRYEHLASSQKKQLREFLDSL